LEYWSRHPEEGSSTSNSFANRVLGSLVEEVETTGIHLNKLPEAETKMKRLAPSVSESKYTTQSFSTVAQSVLKDTATVSGRPKTTYAPSDYSPSATEIRIPDFPKSEQGAITIPCPYCFTELKVEAMSKNRQLWK
jgi:hypothetical protein